MKVRTRLVLIVVAVALVPLVLSGLLAMRVHERVFDAQLNELHRSRAETAAARIEASLEESLSTFELLVTRTIQWRQLSDAERQAALALVYRAQRDVAMITLLDSHGSGIGEAVFRHEADLADGDGAFADHPAASMRTLAAFAQHIPFASAQERGHAVGAPFFGDAGQAPLVSLAFATDGETGPRWTVVVGLSLRSVCALVESNGASDIRTLMVDDHSRILCGPRRGEALTVTADVFTAEAALPGGWRVVTVEARRTALAPSRLIKTQNALVMVGSFVTALVAGLLLARRINRPVTVLALGARALARGEFAHRVGLRSSDELGQLGQAFDHMANEIEKRETAIRAFNTQLQERVDERTHELRETQAALLQSQKVAAVSSLGAGIAHEINNPLTSVLGFAQVLRARAAKEQRPADEGVLAIVEAEAQRIKHIVQTLISFSESYAGEGFTELDINDVCERALAEVPLDEITVVRELDRSLLPIMGAPAQLQEALVQLLKNAATALSLAVAKESLRATLTVRTALVDGVIKVDVSDSGRGIAAEVLPKIFDPFFTTKDEWRGEGLGLTIVHRIVEQHHGFVRAVSQLGAGATFTITLPAASRRAHLV